MNIYLVPHTWARHLVVGVYTAAATLCAWWFLLFMVVQAGPYMWEIGFYWAQSAEGGAFHGLLAGTAAGMTLLAEGSLRRRPVVYRLGYSGIAAFSAFFIAAIGHSIASGLTPYLGSESMRTLLNDASLVSLRYRLFIWGFTGLVAGFVPFVVRQLQRAIARRFGYGQDGPTPPEPPTRTEWTSELYYHLGGGFAAGWTAAAVWHLCGHYDNIFGDLYMAAALASFLFGLVHGLLVWPIPSDLYTGWVRILSVERYGLRIPLDHVDGSHSERFIGHFPRGLDLYLPVENGVAELHTSFVVDRKRRYAVRGLSVKPTIVKRMLERIDLRYDPRRPAPLETELSMEDRIIMGEGEDVSEIEFLLLPKEEQ